ncbi:hypothetical protein B0H21DRAFT_700622, partial [Amylocystis lapponica]
YVGVSLGDTSNHRLALADNGERIFSDNLFGVQIGDRPNLYVGVVVHRHGLLPPSYEPSDYLSEFGQLASVMEADANIAMTNNLSGRESQWATRLLRVRYHRSVYAVFPLAHELYQTPGTRRSFGAYTRGRSLISVIATGR